MLEADQGWRGHKGQERAGGGGGGNRGRGVLVQGLQCPQTMSVGADQRAASIETQLKMWVLHKEVLRKPAHSKQSQHHNSS